ncbi:hypothetical protein B0I08_101261 [Glaciihabitans tibetensis]|uniref:Uncharacterized protein n=1 Tax=Glaciihabitans tibetensis TaxID=1266600 RepID=A0A2T0VIS8_9MICO|nr:hypothetical protein B0I08_101261 [Glaciihabitans tibetensis]
MGNKVASSIYSRSGTDCGHEGLAAFSESEKRSREYPVGGAVAQPAKEYTRNGEHKQ